MHISQHANARSKQRCIPVEAIELALREGDVRHTWGGASIYRLPDRRLRELGAEFDRLRGVEVVEADGTIITVWKSSNRRRRGQGRRLREKVQLREAESARRAWFAQAA